MKRGRQQSPILGMLRFIALIVCLPLVLLYQLVLTFGLAHGATPRMRARDWIAVLLFLLAAALVLQMCGGSGGGRLPYPDF